MDKSIAPIAFDVESKEQLSTITEISELGELQLAFVGGGIGDIIVA